MVKSGYVLPILKDIFDRLQGDVCLVIDKKEGYHKMWVHKDSLKYNVVNTGKRKVKLLGVLK